MKESSGCFWTGRRSACRRSLVGETPPRSVRQSEQSALPRPCVIYFLEKKNRGEQTQHFTEQKLADDGTVSTSVESLQRFQDSLLEGGAGVLDAGAQAEDALQLWRPVQQLPIGQQLRGII